MEGKQFLKISGIILVIIGIAGLALACFAFAGGGLAALTADASGDSAISASGTTAVLGGIIMVVTSIFNLIFGVMAVKNCDNPAKASLLRVMGVILLIFSVAALIIYISAGMSIVIGCIINLIISFLYFWGAQKNLKSA